jgi:hypothetical protein
MDFESSLELGKKSEKLFEQWLMKHYKRYANVSLDVEYQKKDIDFITNKESFEVKSNLNNAKKGKGGLFFWVEMESGNNDGWWRYCEADYFAFFSEDGGKFILLKHDRKFRNFIDGKIETADHGSDSFYRIDIVFDSRTIVKKLMRVYLSELDKEKVPYEIINIAC